MKTAVVLFQLGGPDSLDAVEPFLFNLFMDPDMIDVPIPSFARVRLARYVSRKRSAVVREYYSRIGGASPLLELTRKQAAALEQRLRCKNDGTRVFIAMRSWHPLTEEAVERIRSESFDRVVLLPLYPQFSRSTTLSSMNEWSRQVRRCGLDIPTELVCCYPDHPKLIEAFVDSVNTSMQSFAGIPHEEIELVFSAHGVPERYIRGGDPYRLQVEETYRTIVERGNWKMPSTLCYQSKIGPVRWLRPSLLETVRRLGESGRHSVIVVPLSFVSDHVETLYEIGIDARREAQRCGIERFEVVPALNDHPAFIACLAELVDSPRDEDPDAPCRCARLAAMQAGTAAPRRCPRLHGVQSFTSAR